MKGMSFFIAVVAAYLVLAGTAYAGINEDVSLHKNCKVCGMSREEFAYSRVLIEYDNGTTVATCSTRCAALDLAMNIGRVPKSVKVGDFNSRTLIDAEKAYWVIGGKKEGTMSARGKWAFLKKSEAESFISRNGGKPGTFQNTLKASFEDLYRDLKMFWASMKRNQ